MTASSNIPSSLSGDDLEKLMQAAQEKSQDESVDNTRNFSYDYLTELASEICDSACDRSHGPLIHKAIALTILSRMVEWHTEVGTSLFEDGEKECGAAWLRDAGKLQAAMSQLLEVGLGSDDPFTD